MKQIIKIVLIISLNLGWFTAFALTQADTTSITPMQLIATQSMPNTQWSLEECIYYAIENNLQIKQADTDLESAKLGVQQSKLDYLPSVGANTGYNSNFGRSLDPTSYQFVDNKTVNNLNGSLSAQTMLFAGMSKKYNLENSQLNLQKIVQSKEQIKNDIALAVTAAYLQILFNKEQQQISVSQLELLVKQLSNIKKMVDAGSLPMGDLFEVESQQAAEQYNKVTLDNQLQVSLLTLKQLLEIRGMPKFDIEIPNIGNLGGLNITSIEETYEKALVLPQIQVAMLSYEMTKRDVSLAKAKLYPTLSLGGNYGSSFSDARTRSIPALLPDGTPMFNGGIPVVVQEKYPFADQVNDNLSGAIQLTLNIPIFNGLKNRIGVKTSKWQEIRSEIGVRQAENQLYKDIQQAQTDAQGALSRYESAQITVKSFTQSFDYAEKKFSAGASTSLDYNTAKNNLIQALSVQTQAKYEYLLKTKILDFYNGIPITL